MRGQARCSVAARSEGPRWAFPGCHLVFGVFNKLPRVALTHLTLQTERPHTSSGRNRGHVLLSLLCPFQSF